MCDPMYCPMPNKPTEYVFDGLEKLHGVKGVVELSEIKIDKVD